ncbi:MAG: FKBP-type peptidyl-prolyl cis-trans isomerase [Desulfuromonadaceae bacterium]|nr:FKBP-type peptidyl-prolyl cis-trans isomerase [Desulfuromonadaceae bacterium]MDD2856124.1 FKBP-type peptidyl-prolyl cis-trans isomerase [Desulfuromonadaceae bacterium]
MKKFKTIFKQKLTIKLTGVFLFFLTSSAIYAAEPDSMTEDQKTLYAVGLSVSRSLSVFDLTEEEYSYVNRGILDGHKGEKPKVDLVQYNSKIQELAKTRRKIAGEKQIGAGRIYLENAAKEVGAVKTASGMVYKTLVEGKGEPPTSDDIVKVNYRGTLVDGKEFDSSFKRNRPLEFKLDNVIHCWIEGIQKMKPGGKAKFVCPANLAYGESGTGEMILPGATLSFEVELLEVKRDPTAKKTQPKETEPVQAGKK